MTTKAHLVKRAAVVFQIEDGCIPVQTVQRRHCSAHQQPVLLLLQTIQAMTKDGGGSLTLL